MLSRCCLLHAVFRSALEVCDCACGLQHVQLRSTACVRPMSERNRWRTTEDIYLFYHIFPSTQHTSFEFTATCFDLTSHLQAYLWTLTSYNLPVRIWVPRWLTYVFAYNVISMYYSIYVCIGGWRVCCCCSRGPGPSWFSVFSFFIFSVDGLGGGPVVLLSITVCVLFLLVFCERWLLASFELVDGLPSLCKFHFLRGWMVSHNHSPFKYTVK